MSKVHNPGPEGYQGWLDRQRSTAIAPLLADIVHEHDESRMDAPLLNWLRGFSQDGVPRNATIRVLRAPKQSVEDVALIASLADRLSDGRLVLVFRYSFTDVRVLTAFA